jgi:peptidoglycan/LPS O-acetylase OafA/YrhL
MSKCDQSWINNVLFINNFDDINTCFPWTWFLAVYIQLSLLAPLIIYLLRKYIFICYPLIIICGFVCATVVGLYIWIEQTGISPAYDYKYFSIIYIKPWQHFCGFVLFGLSFGVFFNEYIEKRKRIDIGDKH